MKNIENGSAKSVEQTEILSVARDFVAAANSTHMDGDLALVLYNGTSKLLDLEDYELGKSFENKVKFAHEMAEKGTTTAHLKAMLMTIATGALNLILE